MMINEIIKLVPLVLPILGIIVLLTIILIANIKVVPQSHSYVLERLGQFHDIWGAGLHLKLPFFDRIVKKVTLKEKVADFPPQPVITIDNVNIQIDTIVFFQITDPKLYTYGVENPMMAIENLTATTLRNIIGSLELDQALTSRDAINSQMRAIIDEATDPWGIKVNRIELKNIIPPKQIQDAMEKQMKAEREKREAILNAEGKKQASITEAQGMKEAKILTAQAEKEARILDAEAKKEAAIREAEGQAEALLTVQRAQANALKLLNEVGVKPDVLKLKSFEALEKVADGKATKLIIPADIQNVATQYTEFKEIALEKDAE